MTDYIGNEIKVGDKVYFIKILDRQTILAVCVLIPGTGFSELKDLRRPDKECFIKGRYYKVFEHCGCLGYKIKTPHYTMIDILPPMFLNSETHIIAIKGVSDSKEQYLNFKNKPCSV